MDLFDFFCLTGIALLLILGGFVSLAVFVIKQIRGIIKDLFKIS
jgi:hypothetical protein